MRSSNYQPKLLPLSAAIALAASSLHVQAQDDLDALLQLEEVVVTATRRGETNIQETPIAVTGVSADAIAQRSVTNLADIATFVPGLSIGASQGLGAATGSIAIRGMGVDSSDSEAAVGTYVDEVYFSSGRGNILGLMDAERVEVLRGPQGTLFGRNTISGAIQYVTRAPSDEFNGYITGTVGSYERNDFEAAVNVPVSDTFAVRLAGRYADRDGFVTDELQGIDRGGETTEAGRLRARWTPSDSLSVDLKAEVVDYETNGRAVQILSVNPNAFFTSISGLADQVTDEFVSTDSDPGDYTFRGFDGQDFFKFEQELFQANIEYDINDSMSFKSITSHSSFEHQLAVDIDQITLPIISIYDPNFQVEAFTQEFQLSGSLADDALRYTTGVYYYDRENRQVPSRVITAAGFGGFPLSPDGDPITDVEAIAVYGQVSYDFSDALTANLGLRYSDETVNGRLAAVPGTDVEQSFDDLSPSLGLDYRINDDAFAYVKASKGFRAGGFTLNAALADGGQFFEQEEAWTYEGGLRLTLLDGRMRVNPTIFQTDWSDIQFLDNQLAGSSVIVVTRNAGDARIRGLEIETEFAVTNDLLLRGAFAFLDAEYTRTSDSLEGGTVVVPLGQDLARAPETKASVGANYILPIDMDGELSFTADYNWVDDQAGTARGDVVVLPSVGLLNARLQYVDESERFTVAVFGTNLTNEFYLLGGNRFGTEGTAGADVADLGRPRELGMELRYNF